MTMFVAQSLATNQTQIKVCLFKQQPRLSVKALIRQTKVQVLLSLTTSKSGEGYPTEITRVLHNVPLSEGTSELSNNGKLDIKMHQVNFRINTQLPTAQEAHGALTSGTS